MNSASRPLLFALLTVVMWGFWGFFGKMALQRKMAPVTIFLVETVISALIALPIFLFFYKQRAPSDGLALNIYGILSAAVLAGGLLFYYLALQEASVSLVVPLTATYPIVAVLLSYAFLAEKPGLPQWIGIILVVAGTMLLLSGSPPKLPP